jgi:hypothetical protein
VRERAARFHDRIDEKDGTMGIEVEHLEDWIGNEARSAGGDKLGKIDDIYYAGDDAVAIAIHSGLGGRKHHAASLKGARAARDAINLAVAEDDLVAIDGGPLTSSQIGALATHDERLRDVVPEQIESWTQREERRKEADEVRARAEEFEAEADRLAAEEQAAASHASDAQSAADDLRREREEAEARARDARAEVP